MKKEEKLYFVFEDTSDGYYGGEQFVRAFTEKEDADYFITVFQASWSYPLSVQEVPLDIDSKIQLKGFNWYLIRMEFETEDFISIKMKEQDALPPGKVDFDNWDCYTADGCWLCQLTKESLTRENWQDIEPRLQINKGGLTGKDLFMGLLQGNIKSFPIKPEIRVRVFSQSEDAAKIIAKEVWNKYHETHNTFINQLKGRDSI